jgi:hypothetical protein
MPLQWSYHNSISWGNLGEVIETKDYDEKLN